MREKIGPIPVKRILNSEPAAFFGGLLTTHRDQTKIFAGVQGAVDGVIIGMNLFLVPAAFFDPKLLGVSLLFTRVIFSGGIYLGRIRNHRHNS